MNTQKIIHLTNLSQLPHFQKNEAVAIDTEIFQLNKATMHRPTSGKFAAASFCTMSGTFVITDVNLLQPVLEYFKDGVHVFHNAKFDVTHIRRWATYPDRKKIWDIFLIERILYGGYYAMYSLQALARRYCDIVLEKDTREEFIKASEMTPEMIEYSGMDAYATWRVYMKQKGKLDKNDFRIWTEVDRPALWAVLAFQGIRVDVDAWQKLEDENKEKAAAVFATLPCNPRSPAQVAKLLKEKGFTRLESSGEEVLQKAIVKYPKTEAAELARGILSARKASNMVSKYGMNFITPHLEDDNGSQVIVANYIITGAETGRSACSDPNMQNVPSRETNAFRKCFIPRPGHKLVVLDYSAQEPRVTAFLSDDKRLKYIFEQDIDVYCEMWHDIYDSTITKKDKDKRGKMKSVFLGVAYGLTKWGLAKKEDMTIEEAEEVIARCFKKYSGMAKYVIKQKKKKKYVETIMGRKAWLNPYNPQSERNALNSPIQGSSGDMLKIAYSRMYQEWKFSFPYAVVAVVHDEIVLDVPEEYAVEVGEFASKIMVEVGEEMVNHTIPFKAEASVCDSWADKG